MAKILIVDDNKEICDMVSLQLSPLGHEMTTAHCLEEGIERVSQSVFDLVFLDVHLPDGSGLASLSRFQAAESRPEIIIITGKGDPDGAALAIESGAWDYIEKPLSLQEVALQATRALEYRHEKRNTPTVTLLKKEGIVGSSPKLEACLQQVAQNAITDTPVLITGETGTGKELFARAVHANSNRSSGPFVVLDCTAFPEKLVESMLFGHRKGAFTGADQTHEGLILQADKGTLFMDEVGDLPPSLQKTFLRVLQEHRFRPVGADRESTCDFRLVAATNRDLDGMVQGGQFRKDLLFRLKATTIHLPPLKERKADIEALTMHYISTFCKRYNMSTKGVSPDFLDSLAAYAWSGNVRELVNTIDSAIANAQDHDVLYPMHLPVHIRVQVKQSALGKSAAAPHSDTPANPAEVNLPTLKESLQETERGYLKTLMGRTDGDIKRACQISGLSRSGLYARLKKFAIKRSS